MRTRTHAPATAGAPAGDRSGRRGPATPLGELLLSAGALSAPELSAALEEQQRDGGRLGALLQARGVVGPAALRSALATQFDVATVGADDVPVALLPGPEARRLRAVALWPTHAHERFSARVVAFSDPSPARIAAVRALLGRAVEPRIVDDHTLDDLLQRAYAREDADAVAHALPRERTQLRVLAGGGSDATPTVTVVVALHEDSAATLTALWSALTALRYPVTQLQGIVLVATGDVTTRAALADAAPPGWLRVTDVRVPGAGARAALALHGVRNARGALTVVIDPRLLPAPDHLRDAVARQTAPAQAHVDLDELLQAWIQPGGGTTCSDTRTLLRALDWELPGPAPAGEGPTVWVCVPTYNEAAHVERLCLAVLLALEEAGVDGQLLIIDDGSPDGTGALAEALRATQPRLHVLHRRSKDGIGPAYLAGFAHALANGADLVVEMDCDFSHDPSALPLLVDAAGDADVVLGSRYVPGGRVEDWSLARRLVSRAGCAYAQLALGVEVRDLTGGFKCFRRHVLEQLLGQDVRSAGYGFQIEMTYRALLAGHTVREVPITFRDRTEGESKMTSGIALEAAVTVLGLRRISAGQGPDPVHRAPVVDLPAAVPVAPRREIVASASARRSL